MLECVKKALPADIFIAAAAVADWRVKATSTQKAKKGPDGPPVIELVENPDILATVSQMPAGRPKLVVGFAAETENLVPHATAKLVRKKCDLIIANDVGAEQAIFGGDLNRVVIIDAEDAVVWPQASKAEIASRIAALVAARLDKLA
jgi:phosphopantothenoylcysteine decarboxylase/phosphopantothenate--cysteine ligase